MDQEKYWECFTNSGRVEDYLKYRNCSNGASDMAKTDGDSGNYERNCDSNRDDCSVVSCERIR